jgi:hypothetical protein
VAHVVIGVGRCAAEADGGNVKGQSSDWGAAVPAQIKLLLSLPYVCLNLG